MTDDSFGDCKSRCYAFGIRLVKPKGVRKYYCLDNDRYRFRPTPPSQEPKGAAGSFFVRPSGNIGQEILDADGRIRAWTTDPWMAQVIVKLLNENEGLLR